MPATAGLWVAAGLIVFASGAARVQAADLKLQTQLIWATNDSKSPDPKHKPVQPDVKKKLEELPLKWSHYFEVKRQDFQLASSATRKVPLSDKCELEVKSLGQANFEVTLFGRGEQVVKRTQALPKGETLVLGGNAPDKTAWLVILKRIE